MASVYGEEYEALQSLQARVNRTHASEVLFTGLTATLFAETNGQEKLLAKRHL